MRLADVLLNTVIKKGCSSEIKNFKTTVDVPNQDPDKEPIKIVISSDLIQIKIEKE